MYAKIAEEAKSATSSIGWNQVHRPDPEAQEDEQRGDEDGDLGGGVRRDRERQVHLVPVCEDDGAVFSAKLPGIGITIRPMKSRESPSCCDIGSIDPTRSSPAAAVPTTDAPRIRKIFRTLHRPRVSPRRSRSRSESPGEGRSAGAARTADHRARDRDR